MKGPAAFGHIPSPVLQMHFALSTRNFGGERADHTLDESGTQRRLGSPPGKPSSCESRRQETLCAASMTTAQGGHTHPAGVQRTTGACAQASLWMRRSDATCGYKSRWAVLISQQTRSRFDESERGRSRLSGHFSGNLAWRSRPVRPVTTGSARPEPAGIAAYGQRRNRSSAPTAA